MSELADTRTRTEAASAASAMHPLLDARGVSHRYGEGFALRDVSFAIAPGEIHALLGPNGAGKTTLIRILAGLLTPRRGSVEIGGLPASSNARLYRQQIGFVASGDRTFYLRISGLENLVFFARLHGIRRGQAIPRALAVLAGVGLEDVAQRPVGEYSHGMQKRLSIARALLTSPPVLLIDEATHDLDPEGASRVRDLVAAEASRGAAVAWVTQRLDEIRGFADSVTLVGAGQVRFVGTVPQLLSHVTPSRFLLHLDGHRLAVPVESLGAALAPGSTLVRMGAEDPEHYLLSLGEDSVLGDALASLTSAGVKVLSCREERSEIEQAFLLLLDGGEG